MGRRYKGIATLIWEFEWGDDQKSACTEALRLVRDMLAAHLPAEVLAGFKVNAKADLLKDKKGAPKRIVHGEVPLEEVMNRIDSEDIPQVFVVNGVEYTLGINTTRYKVFKRDGCKCVCCGLAGTVMVLESQRGSVRPHFNLYAKEDDRMVMMTQDHIIPVSLGGNSNLDNLQAMCQICNMLKGDAHVLDLATLRELRLAYNGSLKQGAKATQLKKLKLEVADKEAHARQVIKEEKQKEARFKSRAKVRLLSDLVIWVGPEGGFIGLPPDTEPPTRSIEIGVHQQAGTVIKPLRARNGSVHLPWGNEGKYYRVNHKLVEIVNGEEKAEPVPGSDPGDGSRPAEYGAACSPAPIAGCPCPSHG